MSFYWLIAFLPTLILAMLIGAILASEKKDSKKMSLLLFNTALLIWACLDLLFWIDEFDPEKGLLIQKISSIFWITIGQLFLNFVFKLLNNKYDAVFYIALLISISLTLISVFTDKIIVGIQKEYWGQVPILGSWVLAVLITVVATTAYGILLIINAYRAEKNITIKIIYKHLIIGVVLAVTIVSSIDVILPVLFQIRVISLTTLGISLISLFLLRIINKYHFLDLSVEDFSDIIFDKVSEGVILTDETGEILMANSRANVLIQNNKDEILSLLNKGRKKQDIIKSKLIDPVTKENIYLNTLTTKFADNINRDLCLYILNDVSKLVKYRNLILDKNEELQLTLYRIAHDIKSPAGAIKQLALFSKTDKENIDVYLDKIEIASNQLNRFLKEVELLIRVKETQPEFIAINLKSVVNRSWTELDFYKQNKPHKLELYISHNHFKSDPNLIYAIVLNLLSNAIKYNDIANKSENIITISSAIKNNTLNLQISDNGLGMNEETLNNVSKLFYRGNTNVSGTGIGMHIVKHAIEKLKGEITIKSEIGKGSTFYVKIPIQEL